MLLKFAPLCIPGKSNLIVSLKHRFDNLISLGNILELKALSSYDYIYEKSFPSQQVGHKVYLFKMFIDGTTSEFDLIQLMQPGDDLQNLWMMFNHVKRVQGWTTMACHVYDPFYCKVMTIVVCDM
jgi:hypothetical protein